MDYDQGLRVLKARISRETLQEFNVLEARLRENLASEARYGSSESLRAERAAVIDQINRLTEANLGTSFNQLCLSNEPESNKGQGERKEENRAPRDLANRGEGPDERFIFIEQIIAGLVVMVLPLLGGFILRLLLPDIAPDLGSTFSAFALIAGFGLLAIFIRVDKGTRKTLFLSIVIILSVTSGAAYVVLSSLPRTGTLYLVVDASENMRGAFDRIGSRISLTASRAPENTDVGLMLFGGGTSGVTGCDDITPLVKPARRQISLPEIEKKGQMINDLVPQGQASLQKALLKAITEELAGRPAVQQIIVITSGADTRCAGLDRALLDLAASQKKVRFLLTIATIGPQSQSDEARLEALADRGRYSNLKTTSEVPTIVPSFVYPPYFPYGAPYLPPYGGVSR